MTRLLKCQSSKDIVLWTNFFFGRNFCWIYFCDLRPQSQKFLQQNFSKLVNRKNFARKTFLNSVNRKNFFRKKLIPHFFFFYNKNFGQPRTFKIERITIFILSFCIGLVTQLNGPALGVLKHHYITKRIRELLIGNSRFLIYNLLNQLLYYTV